jgi:erythromycin esterase-like protein
MARIGDAPYVLLGEASHGTKEFYRERAEITKRLIVEQGLTAVAVEADWPDAYRVSRYVRGLGTDSTAVEALSGFKRFPSWMWRNEEVVNFIEWLRAHNASLPRSEPKTGFYGLDLYSLRSSMESVLRYLERVDPDAAARVREHYSCFDHFAEEHTYGFMTQSGATESCEEDVVQALVEMQRRVAESVLRAGGAADEDVFDAVQNARAAKNAEAYYRSMYRQRVSSWNLRDRHMVETLEALMVHLGQQTNDPRVAVWAHNSHLGDARATEMGQRGELNVGQLVRELHGTNAVLVGFTTHHGTVTASTDWDGAAERKRVRPALGGSFEAMFHETRLPRFLLTWRDGDPLIDDLRNPELERAIGVIYRPETERASHYFWASLADQFDAVIHFDETHAVRPLEPTSHWEKGEAPETFPFGQ